MKYLIILGRNIELSVKEVESYLIRINNPLLNYSINKNAILIEVKEKLNNIIENLGGVIAIGEILSSGEIEEITNDLSGKELYSGQKNKFNYVLWNYSKEKIDEISIYLKQKFRFEKLKAIEKKLTGKVKLQNGEIVDNLVSNLIEEEYFLFSKDDENYFGIITQKCNYEELEKRDMNKPVRRESLSISPRLAKILINLSLIKKGETLVDPFCGIGVILQESLIQNLKVIGIDKDREAIKGANQNLSWAKFNRENYLLINNDSSSVNIEKANVIATEPNLGDILKKIPTKEKAQDIQEGFENLMIQVLNNLKNKISGKIVFTAPDIRIGKKRISCNIERILERTKLKLVEGFPIKEFRQGQIVGREIFVLER